MVLYSSRDKRGCQLFMSHSPLQEQSCDIFSVDLAPSAARKDINSVDNPESLVIFFCNCTIADMSYSAYVLALFLYFATLSFLRSPYYDHLGIEESLHISFQWHR